jgi:quercetin 2,3-dioxygenase
MVTVRRTTERQHGRSRKQETWCTFDSANPAAPHTDGFETLESLNEIRLAPGARIPRNSRHDAEVVTYVCEGILAYEDSLGHSAVVQSGEFQRVSTDRSLRHSKMNASRSDWAHFYQIWLRPSEAELEAENEQKRFSAAERRNRLCVIASSDARRGSLRVHQNVLVCSALLDPGQHIVHELAPGRSAWLHLVHGKVTLGDVVLTTGDGAGVTADRAVSLTASEEAEILLVDVGQRAPPPSASR